MSALATEITKRTCDWIVMLCVLRPQQTTMTAAPLDRSLDGRL
jgi:hypothetical protein